MINVKNLIFDGSNNGTNSHNLTIIVDNLQTDGATVFEIYPLVMPAENIVIKNCIIINNNPFLEEEGNNIFYAKGWGKNVNNVSLINNLVNGGLIGFDQATNVNIIENHIANSEENGIYFYLVENAIVRKNMIKNIYSSNPYYSVIGINLRESSNIIIESNTIDSLIQNAYEASDILISNDSSNNITIQNNIIRNICGAGNCDPQNEWPNGIKFLYAGYDSSKILPNSVKIYHNNIELKSTNNTNRLTNNAGSAGIILYSTTFPLMNKIDIRNNIIRNTLGKQSTASNTQSTALFFRNIKPSYCSNNIYDVKGADFNNIGMLDYGSLNSYASMHDWRLALQNECNISDYSFAYHAILDTVTLKPLNTYALANNTGAKVLVSIDYIGNPRNVNNPDIGAWEYNGIPTVKGILNNDTSWNADVAIVDNFVIANDKTLTINPGTKIIIADSLVLGYRFPLIINGKLIANGTISDTIAFMPITRSRWGGLHFKSANSGSTLHFVNMLADTLMGNFGFDTAITIVNTPNLTISHLRLDTNTYM